jgi:hypothetical protein
MPERRHFYHIRTARTDVVVSCNQGGSQFSVKKWNIRRDVRVGTDKGKMPPAAVVESEAIEDVIMASAVVVGSDVK